MLRSQTRLQDYPVKFTALLVALMAIIALPAAAPAQTEDRLRVPVRYQLEEVSGIDSWHQGDLELATLTSIGPVLGRLSFANRYGNKGFQYGADAYPRIGKRAYLYTAAAYSDDRLVFVPFRAALEPYFNLDKGWETSAGLEAAIQLTVTHICRRWL